MKCIYFIIKVCHINEKFASVKFLTASCWFLRSHHWAPAYIKRTEASHLRFECLLWSVNTLSCIFHHHLLFNIKQVISGEWITVNVISKHKHIFRVPAHNIWTGPSQVFFYFIHKIKSNISILFRQLPILDSDPSFQVFNQLKYN